jgi:hypothetical protein
LQAAEIRSAESARALEAKRRMDTKERGFHDGNPGFEALAELVGRGT